MVPQQLHRLRHGLLHAVEPPQPRLEIDAAVAHHVNVVLGDPPLDEVADHHIGVDMRHAAVVVPDDHDLLHAQLHDTHQQAPHRAVKGSGDHATGVLDELHVAVAYAQRRRQQLHQPRVHAGENGDLLVGVLAGLELFITLGADKLAVICQHFFDHGGSSFRVFSIIPDFPPPRNRNLPPQPPSTQKSRVFLVQKGAASDYFARKQKKRGSNHVEPLSDGSDIHA